MTLPSGWTNQDIGSATGGTTQYSNGVFAISGAGTALDYNATSDNIQIAYRTVGGDISITARVLSDSETDNAPPFLDQGVFIRQSASPGSMGAYLHFQTPGGGGIKFATRVANGAVLTVGSDVGSATAPFWFRLLYTLAANQIAGFISSDGVNFTQVGSVTIPLGSGAIAGIFADQCPAGYYVQSDSVVVTAGGAGSGGGTGTGPPDLSGPFAVSGIDPQIILQISDDGGRTWGAERPKSIGKLGDYRTLVRWQRLGTSRNRSFRVICSAPVFVALVAADLDADPGTS
jgi:hypothetical protein